MTSAQPRRNLSLTEAAEQLGVHYMTVYRYIRLGRLPAQQHNGRWTIDSDELGRLTRSFPRPTGRRSRPAWPQRRRQLVDRLLAGDAVGGWEVVKQALLGGASSSDTYVDLIGPALRQIGEQWAAGYTTIEQEHRATAIALRLVGRIGPSMTRPGRPRKGTVVIGGAAGDHHLLPVAMMADVLRSAGFQVADLGADVPTPSFLQAAATGRQPLTVGISLSYEARWNAAAKTIASLKRNYPDALLLAGGPALPTRDAALELGADDWAPDAIAAARLLGPS
jgi:MerR family transcriptional regulator, light-induced transcriptional regulator